MKNKKEKKTRKKRKRRKKRCFRERESRVGENDGKMEGNPSLPSAIARVTVLQIFAKHDVGTLIARHCMLLMIT